MSSAPAEIIVVTGATGLQGGAVARSLLRRGWLVRALTRDPRGPRAAALAALGAEVARADLRDPHGLRLSLEGAHGVYSVQNPHLSDAEDEVRQGRNVADAAREAGVRHLVYGSAGPGVEGTGVPSWESKLRVEEHMRRLGIPLTILRPTAFMELMTEKHFYPPMAAWHLMPRLVGETRPLPWLSVADLGEVAAEAFADPARFVGRELKLAADLRSLADCRVDYREVLGKAPPRWPMPGWLFERFGFVGRDLVAMWKWLRTGELEVDPAETRAVHPGAKGVRDWLRGRKTAAA